MNESISLLQDVGQIYNPLIATITASYINRPESLKNLAMQEYIIYFCQEYQKINTVALQTNVTLDFDGNYVLNNNTPKR